MNSAATRQHKIISKKIDDIRVHLGREKFSVNERKELGKRILVGMELLRKLELEGKEHPLAQLQAAAQREMIREELYKLPDRINTQGNEHVQQVLEILGGKLIAIGIADEGGWLIPAGFEGEWTARGKG